jgi:hypothetical protein
VNAEGLIETAQVLGSELITNGDFATDSDWAKGAGWAISGGKAIYSGSGNNGLIQNSIFTTAKKYQLKFDLISNGNTIKFWVNGTQNIFSSNLSTGSYTYYITANTSGSAYFESTSTFAGSIDNVSVKEVFENDVPRLDYSDGSCASLLLEPQSTNLVTYSEDYSQIYWRKDKLTATANSATSPSGLTDAFLIQETTYTNSIPSFDLQNTNTLSVGTYTFSFYVKNNNGRYLGISFGSSGERVRTNFDFNTNTFKTLNLSGSTTGSASYTTLGDYYRISISATFPSSVAADIVLMPLATDTYPFFAFQDSDNRSFYLWGIQVEQSSYATSYIPTSGSTVTRTADVCNNAGTSATFNDSEGVLFAEIAALAEVGDGTTRLSISDGSQDNNITIGYSATNTLRTIIRSGASNQALMTSSQTITNYLKVAVKYKANDFALWVNGVEVATDTSGLAPVGLSELSFDRGDAALPFYGKTKQLMTFNEALSDEELSDLTGQVNLSFNNLATFYGYTIL